MNEEIIVKFCDCNCKIVKGHYSNGRIALQLFDINDGSPVAKATINLPEFDLADDEVFIKNYSENEGLLDVLIAAKVISLPLRRAVTKFVSVPVCKLLI